ncbi:hypothetical protein evm_014541 [Chilo suppressalis]|nr:hypothetical protein evm_014541 [Chilo suppressalis]
MALPCSLRLENFDVANRAVEKQCRELSELQTCVVSALETCPTPTTGNIVESMFKFVRKSTPCADVPLETKKNVPGSGNGLAVTSATIILAFSTMFV